MNLQHPNEEPEMPLWLILVVFALALGIAGFSAWAKIVKALWYWRHL